MSGEAAGRIVLALGGAGIDLCAERMTDRKTEGTADRTRRFQRLRTRRKIDLAVGRGDRRKRGVGPAIQNDGERQGAGGDPA